MYVFRSAVMLQSLSGFVPSLRKASSLCGFSVGDVACHQTCGPAFLFWILLFMTLRGLVMCESLKHTVMVLFMLQ